MKIIYSDQPVEVLGKRGTIKSIFLVGPTPRDKKVKSWRPEAIEILKDLGFNGIVFVPEWSTGEFKGTYLDQVDWEWKALHLSSAIAAWVPRSLPGMPALTTNFELGYWLAKSPQKVRYGRPEESAKNRYLDWSYSKCTGRTPQNSLEGLLKEGVVF